jgi:hypothetical protein
MILETRRPLRADPKPLRVLCPQIEKPCLNRYQEHYRTLNTTLIVVYCLLFTQRKMPILRYSVHLTGVIIAFFLITVSLVIEIEGIRAFYSQAYIKFYHM